MPFAKKYGTNEERLKSLKDSKKKYYEKKKAEVLEEKLKEKLI